MTLYIYTVHRVGRRDTPECTFCGKDEESVGHFLLECKRWDRERNVISDLIDKGNEEASLQALLQEVGRLARFVRLTGRLEIRRGERGEVKMGLIVVCSESGG